jgi:NAD-dependent deacetylase
MDEFVRAAQAIRNADRVVAFTGAGISVESGIPPFRGSEGLWSRYDPRSLEIHYFMAYPKDSWKVIKEIFYDFFGHARPNAAHVGLASLERSGYLNAIITQNIDNLHQRAGSRAVIEYHGSSQSLVCLTCGERLLVTGLDLTQLPPRCACQGLLKPDFVFFGEPIPEEAHLQSLQEARRAGVFLLVGTTGEVIPAALIPWEAKRNGAAIIEVNIEESAFTHEATDIFLQGKATAVVSRLAESLIS